MSFFSHFIRRPSPNFVSYDLSVISLKKEHKCYGIGKLIRIDSNKEQEKMMLDKVDRSSVATDLATSCQGRIGFCRFRKPFNLVSLMMKVLLLATLLSADKLLLRKRPQTAARKYFKVRGFE